MNIIFLFFSLRQLGGAYPCGDAEVLICGLLLLDLRKSCILAMSIPFLEFIAGVRR